MSVAGHRILIIDDDVDLLETLGDFLTFEGFAVTKAPSGEDGLQKLQGELPDLIILDMSMPGMGGVAFLNEITSKERTKGLPVIVFTARANMEQFFKGTDVAGFMSKPCDPDALLRDVRKVLASRPSRTAAAAKAAPASGKPSSRGMRVALLGEDEGGRRDSIQEALGEAGFKVVCVATGPAVLEAAILERPDVIVIKLVLELMNGDMVASRLAEVPTTEAIPVVLYDDTGSMPRDKSFAEGGSGRRRFVRTAKPSDLVAAVKVAMRA